MENIPLSLIVWYILFIGFLDTHKRHFKNFSGASEGFRALLSVSVSIGWAIKFIFLFWYGYLTIWYMPIILYILGGVLMGSLFSVFDVAMKEYRFLMSPIGFVVLPVSAYYAYTIVQSL